MAWDFSTDPEYQSKLDWADAFVREEVELLDVLFPHCEFLPLDDLRRSVVEPLMKQVKEQGLWACHLGPEHGGSGYGAVKLTLLNEILGRSFWAPVLFGCMAPDTGNGEILARFGTTEQKQRYLGPLMEREIISCFSMTEPQGGADPKVFTTTAVRDGDEWVINGAKYFSSHATVAAFLIVMAVTNPDVPVHHGSSMFLVPAGTPGVHVETEHHIFGGLPHEPGHPLLRFEDARVPADAMLGDEGQAFHIAQSRLAGGRIHMAMRTMACAGERSTR